MDFISTLLIAIALAMDAFSVSLTKGFTMKNITKTQILWFATFFRRISDNDACNRMVCRCPIRMDHIHLCSMGCIHTTRTYWMQYDTRKLNRRQ